MERINFINFKLNRSSNMIFSVIKKKKLKNIVNERNYGFIVAGNDFWPTLYLHEFRVNTSGLAHR